MQLIGDGSGHVRDARIDSRQPFVEFAQLVAQFTDFGRATSEVFAQCGELALHAAHECRELILSTSEHHAARCSPGRSVARAR